MKSKFYGFYNSISDIELLRLIAVGKKELNKENATEIFSILSERGYSDKINLIAKSTFSFYDDKYLISIVEAEEGKYSPNIFEIAESILINRGYEIQEDDLDESNDHIIFIEEEKGKEEEVEFNSNKKTLAVKYFYSKTNVAVYRDQSLKEKIRVIQESTFNSYSREIIRKGKELIQLRESHGRVSYILNASKAIFVCKQFQVGKYPIDVLLINHNDFGNYLLTPRVERINLAQNFEGIIDSHIHFKVNKIIVKSISYVEDNMRKILRSNKIEFKPELNTDQVKLRRMNPGDTFYSTKPLKINEANYIRLPDHQEAIIISDILTFQETGDTLKKITYLLIKLFYILIIIAIVSWIYKETESLVFIGIFIPIAYFLAIVIVNPLYLVAKKILKLF